MPAISSQSQTNGPPQEIATANVPNKSHIIQLQIQRSSNSSDSHISDCTFVNIPWAISHTKTCKGQGSGNAQNPAWPIPRIPSTRNWCFSIGSGLGAHNLRVLCAKLQVSNKRTMLKSRSLMQGTLSGNTGLDYNPSALETSIESSIQTCIKNAIGIDKCARFRDPDPHCHV